MKKCYLCNEFGQQSVEDYWYMEYRGNREDLIHFLQQLPHKYVAVFSDAYDGITDSDVTVAQIYPYVGTQRLMGSAIFLRPGDYLIFNPHSAYPDLAMKMENKAGFSKKYNIPQ